MGDVPGGCLLDKFHFIATSRPPKQLCEYKNAVCNERVDLLDHLSKYLCKSASHYNSKFVKENWAREEKVKAEKEIVLNRGYSGVHDGAD